MSWEVKRLPWKHTNLSQFESELGARRGCISFTLSFEMIIKKLFWGSKWGYVIYWIKKTSIYQIICVIIQIPSSPVRPFRQATQESYWKPSLRNSYVNRHVLWKNHCPVLLVYLSYLLTLWTFCGMCRSKYMLCSWRLGPGNAGRV